MPTSPRWKSLKRGVLILRAQLLPSAFHPLGVYPRSKDIQARTRAFLVLSHAEVESYLEEWAKDIARKAETLWSSKRRTSTPLLCLHASLGKPLGNVETLNGANVRDPEARLSDSVIKAI